MSFYHNGWSLVVLLLIGGYLTERFFLRALRRLARKTAWELDDIIIKAMRGRVGKWSALAALYYAIGLISPFGDAADLLRHLLMICFILSIAFALSEIASGAIMVYAKKSPRIFPSTSIFTNLTSSVLFILAILLVLQSLGISVAPLLTALGVGGLAVALALQDTLSNFFAGLHLLAARPIRPGDYIRLDSGEEGYIVDITWRNTSIRDLMQNMVIVPNSKMAEAKIVNYNLPEKHMLMLVPLAVSYDSDLEKVEQIALEVASAVMRKVNETPSEACPTVRFHSFGDYSVECNVMLCVKQFSSQYYIRHEFIKLLQKRFVLAAISLPEPTQIVTLRQQKEADLTSAPH